MVETSENSAGVSSGGCRHRKCDLQLLGLKSFVKITHSESGKEERSQQCIHTQQCLLFAILSNTSIFLPGPEINKK